MVQSKVLFAPIKINENLSAKKYLDISKTICRCSHFYPSINYKTFSLNPQQKIFELWNNTEQTRRALNSIDDSRDGINRYLKRNPTTCFLAYDFENPKKIIGVILTGHDGRRAIIHHLCVHPNFCRLGIAEQLVKKAEEALSKEGITKAFGLVFKDNDAANIFWEKQGYSIRTNLNYRNKSLNKNVPQGE